MRADSNHFSKPKYKYQQDQARPGQASSTSNICHSESFVEISAIFVNCFNTRIKHLFESQYWPI